MPNAHVTYLDDVSVIGSIPMVNINNNKLYVVELTPRSFNFAGTVKAGGATLTIEAVTFTQQNLSQYKYKVLLPTTDHNKPGCLLFYPDDTECVWAGVLYYLPSTAVFDPANPPSVFR